MNNYIFTLLFSAILPLQAGIGYLALLQHKNDPHKSILLCSNFSNADQSAIDVQIADVEELLATKDATKVLLLIQSSKYMVELLRAQDASVQFNQDVLSYLRKRLLKPTKKPELPCVNPATCGIFNASDFCIEKILSVLHQCIVPSGNYPTLKEMVLAQERSGPHPSIFPTPNSPIFDEIENQLSQAIAPLEDSTVLVKEYLDRLDSLERMVSKARTQTGDSPLNTHFQWQLDNARAVVDLSNGLPTTTFGSFVCSIIKKNRKSRIQTIEFLHSLRQPFTTARALIMLSAVLEQQKRHKTIIMVGECKEMLAMEEQLLHHEYDLKEESHLFTNFISNQKVGGLLSVKVPHERGVLTRAARALLAKTV